MKIVICFICFYLSFASLSTAQNYTREVVLKLEYNLELHMFEEKFDSTKHSFKYCMPVAPDGDWMGLCLIDNKPVFGTDWGMPHSYLKKAYIQIKNLRIQLDVSCMFDPMYSKYKNGLFSVEIIEGGFLIKGSFSDGAGSYEVNWSIINNVSIRTKINKFN